MSRYIRSSPCRYGWKKKGNKFILCGCKRSKYRWRDCQVHQEFKLHLQTTCPFKNQTDATNVKIFYDLALCSLWHLNPQKVKNLQYRPNLTFLMHLIIRTNFKWSQHKIFCNAGNLTDLSCQKLTIITITLNKYWSKTFHFEKWFSRTNNYIMWSYNWKSLYHWRKPLSLGGHSVVLFLTGCPPMARTKSLKLIFPL